MPDPEQTSPSRDEADDPAEASRIQSSSGGTGSTRMILDKLLAHAPRESRYRIKEELARGGMGAILRVFDEGLGRELAMKVILQRGPKGAPPVSGTSTESKMLSRFLEEAQVTGQLDHPCIVPVHELGIDSSGSVFFTMQLVKGRDLRQVLKQVWREEDGWNLARALGVIVKVCEAMAYSHSKQVIHRDLKPGNIMVGRYGEVYVMDWGLARVMGRADLHDLRLASTDGTLSEIITPRESSPDGSILTMDGEVLGTPAYMPPEQATGDTDRVGPCSDVYSVGAILYHLLARQRPFEEEGLHPYDLVIRLLSGPPRPLDQIRSDIPRELIGICDRAMARDPADRYADIGALGEDLRRFLEGRVVEAFETGPWAEFKKWVLRNKALSISVGAAILLGLAGLNSTLYVQWKGRRVADQHAAAAREAQLRAEQTSYVANITAASASLKVGNMADVSRRLDACPAPMRGWEWDHLDLRQDLAQRTMSGHGSRITAMALSPDGQRLATGSSDRICVWDAGTGQSLATLSGQDALWNAILLDTTGGRLVSSALDRLVLWDVAKGQALATLLENQFSIPDPVLHEGSSLVACAEGAEVLVWSSETGELRHRFTGHADTVNALAFSGDAHRLASGSSDGTLRLWDLGAGGGDLDLRQPDQAVRGPVDHVAFVPGSGMLVSSSGRTVSLWTAVGAWVRSFEAPGSIGGMRASPDGRLLAVACPDSNVVLWEVGAEESWVLEGRAASWRDLRFSTDSRRLYAHNEDREQQAWDVQGPVLAAVPEFVEDTRSIILRPDTGTVFTGHSDGAVRAWRFGTRDGHVELHGHDYEVMCAVFSPNGTRIVSGALDGRLFVWDAATAEAVQILVGHDNAVNDVVWIGDGEVLSASDDGTMRVWDAASGHCQRILSGSPGPVRCVAVSVDGGVAVSGNDKSHALDVWDLESGSLDHRLVGHSDRVNDVVFLSDGRVVSGSADGSIRVWKVDRSEAEVLDAPGTDPDGQALGVRALCVLEGGRIAAAVDHTIRVWSTIDGSSQLLRGHQEPVLALGFGLKGGRLVSASRDGTLRVWDVELGHSLLVLHAHAEEATAVAVHPEGLRLVSGSFDRTLKVWETQAATARSGWEGSTRQALVVPLLERMLEEHRSVDVVARKLEEDLDLEAGLRGTARRELEARGHWVARRLSRDSRDLSLSSDEAISGEERRRAMEWARSASDHDPGNRAFLLTLGMAQYRFGIRASQKELMQAFTTLTRAGAMEAEPGPSQDDEQALLSCFLAMTHASLGNHEDARSLEATAREVAGEAPSWELEQLLEECQTVIEGSTDR